MVSRRKPAPAKSGAKSSREIQLGGTSILIGPGLLTQVGAMTRKVAPAHRYAIITDSNIEPLYASKVESQFERGSVGVLTVSAGEASKTRDMWTRLTDQMLGKGYVRDSAVIALGGGVVIVGESEVALVALAIAGLDGARPGEGKITN